VKTCQKLAYTTNAIKYFDLINSFQDANQLLFLVVGQVDVECQLISYVFPSIIDLFKDFCRRHLFVTIGLLKFGPLQLIKRFEEIKEED